MEPDELVARIAAVSGNLPEAAQIVGDYPDTLTFTGKFVLNQRVMVVNPFVKMVRDIVGGRGYYGHVIDFDVDEELGQGMVYVRLSGCTGERSPIHDMLTARPLPFFEFELEAAD